VNVFRRRRNFDGDGAGGFRNEPPHADAGRNDTAVAGAEPLGGAAGSVGIPDDAFQDNLVLGDLAVPVEEPIVSSVVKAESEFYPRVTEERMRVRLLQIANEVEMLLRDERGIFLGTDGNDLRSDGAFHYSTGPPGTL
jgi:hypothetical protein